MQGHYIVKVKSKALGLVNFYFDTLLAASKVWAAFIRDMDNAVEPSPVGVYLLDTDGFTIGKLEREE